MTELVVRKYLPEDNKSCRDLWRELIGWHRRICKDQTIGGSNPEDFFDKQQQRWKMIILDSQKRIE